MNGIIETRLESIVSFHFREEAHILVPEEVCEESSEGPRDGPGPFGEADGFSYLLLL